MEYKLDGGRYEFRGLGLIPTPSLIREINKRRVAA